jgi:hypothetical protein
MHKWIHGFILVFILLFSSLAWSGEYVGSEKCSTCHMAKYNDWKTSGHPYILRPASIAQYEPIPLPNGYIWNDISYMVGGARWKARFVGKDGYIITTDKEGNSMPTQWNLATGRWVDFSTGKPQSFNCGPCHTTGYSTAGNQGGLPGIEGTWKFEGVQCERCHGPGADHAATGDKERILIDRTAEFCGSCHVQGEKEKIKARKGFIASNSQYNEYLASPHLGKLVCTSCHDPHKPARYGIKTSCEECHGQQQYEFKGSTMERAGVKCIDCHMPRIGKSAEGLSPSHGDVRTHSWKISVDPEASMFTKDGKYTRGILTVDVVCLSCHGNQSVRGASKRAIGIHSQGK